MLVQQAVDAGVQFDDDLMVVSPTCNTSGQVTGVAMKTPADGRTTSCAHGDCRRWTAVAPGTCPEAREASGAAAPVGDWRLFRGRAAVDYRWRNAHQARTLHWRRPDARRAGQCVPGRAARSAGAPGAIQPAGWPLCSPGIRNSPPVSPTLGCSRPHILGPMAVDASAAGEPGLLLAGDAAGFIDPMTGDGLRFAFSGAALAASVALDVLAGRVALESAPLRLGVARGAAFGAKWRFNRSLRALVSSDSAVGAAAVGARLLPSAFEAIIRYAGDCHVAAPQTSGRDPR